MPVITVSHQLGSGGGEIARTVAERLGYQCVGAEVLAKAAHEHGLAEERLSHLGEAKPPFLERLGVETRVYIAVMQTAMLEAALQDDVVLIGRGGQWLLRDIDHVLRLRIIAPFDERVRRLAGQLAAPGDRQQGLQAAQHAVADLVRRDDADKRGRMHYLYDRDIDDPVLYDVVVNSGREDLDGIAGVVATLARHPMFTTTDGSRRRLVDRALASRVTVALMFDERTRRGGHYTVEAEAGTVRISTTSTGPVVAPVARTVPGVTDVIVDEIPAIPPMTSLV